MALAPWVMLRKAARVIPPEMTGRAVERREIPKGSDGELIVECVMVGREGATRGGARKLRRAR